MKFWKEMSKSERMQLKALVCLLGVFLLFLLAVVSLLHGRGDEEETPQQDSVEEEHIPVVEHLRNVWIMEADGQGLLCYVAGEERLLQLAAAEGNGSGEIPGQRGTADRPGSAGEPGTMGQPDSAGQTGTAGMPGSAGQTGTAGMSGSAGQTGTAGMSGSAGQTGTAGMSGSIGQTGTAGQPENGLEQGYLQEDWGTEAWSLRVREQVADLELTDGLVTGVDVKSQKVSGRVLAVDQDGVWLEGQGKLEFARDVQGYRLYRELMPATYRDLRIGYDFADFCLEEGKICAILLAREEAMETIRVLLKNSDYQGIYHDRVELTCDTDYIVQEFSDTDLQETVTSHGAGESIELTARQGVRLVVKPAARTGKMILQSVHRSQGIPAYRGSLELLWTEGGMVLVNELPLEEYLYSVVPSEMPASYPQEALKAQAICARTYAYTHMQRAGYEALGAHVDDSSSYQVYNNILEQEEATAAVKATFGQLLVREDGVTPAETYYYSTSWGYGSDAHVWKTSAADSYGYIVPRHLNRGEMGRVLTGAVVETAGEAVGPEELTQEEIFAAAIRSTDPGDFEAGEGWYRWTYTVKTLDPARILERLQDRCDTNDRLVLTRDGEDYVSSPVKSFREIRNLTVLARGAGGVADELLIETDQDTYKVISENTIRYVLCDGETLVRRQDGSQVAAKTLLPSAFFTIEIAKEGETVVGYNLTGGGFGHGVGMSQNGARSMAAEGYGAGDILRFFYEGCSVKEIYYDGEAD